jgi:hypothetical protein
MKFLVKLFSKNVFVDGNPYGKKVDYNDYYLMAIDCKNCNDTTRIYIKKSVHVNDIVTGVKCNNCDCRLEKQEK